ncbi:MAG: cupin domain-containing protein [Bacteroidetes bacterium]|nr:cupin domain-containing protein [Bacteroidota bacterium]
MYQNPTDTENAMKLPIAQDAWMLLRFDNHELIRIHLSPGASIENHINDWRIVFYLLQGEGELNVEGRSHHMLATQSIAVEAGRERFWHNTGKEELQLLVIKTREENVRDF